MKDERDTTQKANDDRANKVRSYDMMQSLKNNNTAVIAFNRKPFYINKNTEK